MPELPEVETVARQLAPHLTGRRLVGLHLRDRQRLGGLGKGIEGERVIRSVRRIGKEVVLTLDPARGAGDAVYLCVHLRMTGRLIFSDRVEPDDVPHLRAWLELDRGRVLFQDPRRFGTLRLAGAEPQAPGLDPMTSAFTARRLATLLAGSRAPIKPWLLRQDRLVGMGNIYASESLFAAGIAPHRAANSLSDEEVGRLRRAIRKVLLRAIEDGGTTFSDFRDPEGRRGNYGVKLAVYDREGEPCRHCRRPIERLVQAQRSTFYCGACQR